MTPFTFSDVLIGILAATIVPLGIVTVSYLVALTRKLEIVHTQVNSRLTNTQEKLDDSIGQLSQTQEKLDVSLSLNENLAERISKLESRLEND